MKTLTIPSLSGALRQALIQQEGSLSKAAERLGLSDNSLRVWLKRNRYPETELGVLIRCARLGDDLAELRAKFGFELTQAKRSPLSKHLEIRKGAESLERALTLVDDRMEYFGRLHQQFGEDVRLLFGSMDRGDVFVYLSPTDFPFEMSSTGWGESGELIAAAIRKGAYFIYLHPSDGVADALRRLRLSGIPSSDEYEVKFQKFRAALRNLLHAGTSLNDDFNLERQVIKIPCAHGVFLAPGHKYVLFKPRKGTARLLARLPTGSSERASPLHLPLDQDTTDHFASFVGAALEQLEGYSYLVALLDETNANG